MPRGPRKLVISGRPDSLTRYGGVYLLHRFFTRIGLKHALSQHFPVGRRNSHFSTGELVLAMLYPIILGIKRLETTRLLRTNGLFQYLTGLESYPHATTLQRFLKHTAVGLIPRLRSLHDKLLNKLEILPKAKRRTRFVFDLDSTVLVVYGNQEGAERGYNPAKRGRRSYHPLLAFEGDSQQFWAGEFRPGNLHTATGTLDLLTECLRKIPAVHGRLPVFFRGDKGFYDRAVVEWLDNLKIGFAIVAKITAPVKRKLANLRYHTFGSGLAVAAFWYQPTLWSKSFRFIAVRRPVEEEDAEQLTLFQMKRHTYQVIVTNMVLSPLNIWKFYNKRASVEQLIRELKGDYGIGHIPTHHYMANEAYFHLLLLAYNCVVWFQHTCLPVEMQVATLQRLREDLLVMPAHLTRTNNRPRLWIPDDDLAKTWQKTLEAIEHIEP
jgi:hypothetical protein